MSIVFTTTPLANIELSHTWRTSIQTTIAGEEKRSAEFTWPRLSLNHKYMISSTDYATSNKIRRHFYKDIKELWELPLFPDRTTLTTQADTGQSNLVLDEIAYRHFYEGRRCIVVNSTDDTSYETFDIITISGSTITVSDTLASTWPSNSYVYPLYAFRIAQAQEVDKSPENIDTFTISAVEEFETERDFTYTIPTISVATYSGIDLFLNTPIEALKHSYTHPYTLTQYLGKGLTYSYYDDEDTEITMATKYMEGSKQELWEIMEFFDNKQGRLEPFWVPTWGKDIIVTSAITVSGTVLDIENIEYTTYYLPSDIINRHVLFKFPDNTYACRKIVTSTSTTITLDSALGTAVSAANLSKMYNSFLIYGRFNIDELLVIYFHNQDIAKISINFKNLIKKDL